MTMDTHSPGAPESNAEKWNRWGSKVKPVLMIIAFIIVGFLWYSQKAAMGKRFAVNDKESVHYSEQATEDDAKNLAEILKANQYFTGQKEMDVLLKMSDEQGTIVSFVLNSSWNDEPLVEFFKTIGEDVSAKGFGQPVTVRLVDVNLNTKNEIVVK